MEGPETLVGDVKIIEQLESEIVTTLSAMNDSPVGEIREVRRQLSKRISPLPAPVVIQLALRLIKFTGFAPRFVAYELVHNHKAALASLNSRNITALGNGIDSWSTVDTFACYLSGPAWREQQIPDALIEKWTRSKDRWWRRSAVVSTVALNNKARGGRGDTNRTIQICRLVIDDRDDMVVKALSWSLRELSKRDEAAVKKFVSENKARLAPRVLREVKTKLTTGVKNPKPNRT